MLYFEAFIFLAIGGFLFRISLNKNGERVSVVLKVAGIIAILIFVIMAFRACQESGNPDNVPFDERIQTKEGE